MAKYRAMISMSSLSTMERGLNGDDPNMWSKSKKKRMRQKRKKMEEAAAAKGAILQKKKTDDESNITHESPSKRQKIASPVPSNEKSLAQPDAQMNDATNESKIDSSPDKSPKRKRNKKKRKKQNQSDAMDISPLKQQKLSTKNEQNTTQLDLKEEKQRTSTKHTSTNAPSKSKPTMMSTLQKSFLARLTSSRFRELNEELYTKPSSESFAQFTSNPELFEQYHLGFRKQVEEWPVNPIDVIYKKIVGSYRKMEKKGEVVVADFGCGDAKLAERLLALYLDEKNNLSTRSSKKSKKTSCRGKCPFQVHSFDLVSGGNSLVTPADMTNVPLQDESVDIGVYCLALMGTNVADFVREGWRVVKCGGILRVAEVRSRFEACVDKGDKRQHSRHKNSTGSSIEEDSPKPLMILDDFINLMERCGFECTYLDQSNKMFLFMDFVKGKESPGLSDKESFSAKPCIYKRR